MSLEQSKDKNGSIGVFVAGDPRAIERPSGSIELWLWTPQVLDVWPVRASRVCLKHQQRNHTRAPRAPKRSPNPELRQFTEEDCAANQQQGNHFERLVSEHIAYSWTRQIGDNATTEFGPTRASHNDTILTFVNKDKVGSPYFGPPITNNSRARYAAKCATSKKKAKVKARAGDANERQQARSDRSPSFPSACLPPASITCLLPSPARRRKKRGPPSSPHIDRFSPSSTTRGTQHNSSRAVWKRQQSRTPSASHRHKQHDVDKPKPISTCTPRSLNSQPIFSAPSYASEEEEQQQEEEVTELLTSASTMDTASTASGPQFVGEIGVKGELYIAVDKTEYHAGDTVTGRLTVNVSETIQCDTLVFTITGEEIAQWTERGDHHSRYQEFLKHDILVNVLPNPYLPGEYLYPFQYTLPADLPGVVDADSLYGDFKALHATIKYTLKASIKVEGRFVSDLESTHSLVVREKSKEREVVSHGVERTVSKRVRFLGCISRGTCHVAASMKKNVLALGESARIDIFVNNHTSSVGIKSVKCRLYQDVTLQDSSGVDKICSRPLLQVKCDGPSSGELLERPIDMVLAGKMRFPSTKGSFLACSYRISLECEIFLSKTIKIDIPVTILPAQGPLRPLNTRGLSTGMQPHIPPGGLVLTHQQSGGGVVLTPASSASGSSQPFAHLVTAQPPLPTIDLMA